jgi:2-polyprenyl-6-methoxyphenol hydroxylase-like FAD-dependent oxidoreductase
MGSPDHVKQVSGETSDYDAVIVGASLAGSATAILLGRAGARVALVEKQPDPAAFKRICSHYIQSSAVATLARLGVVEEMIDAGAVRSRLRIWTSWGWIVPPANSAVPSGINLRREVLDPLVRAHAAQTTGVDLILGATAHDLLREDDRVCGVEVRDRNGHSRSLRAQLVVGADGRDSRVAELAKVRSRTKPHGRFAYGGYFEGPKPAGAPDGSAWMLDPHWAAAFPTDAGLTFYACMPTTDRLPEFRSDPAAAIVEFVAGVPDAPPIRDARLVGSVLGKLEMPNVMRGPTAPGLALVGDAALAIDPLFGVGCGWALQSAEWLADSVTPALLGEQSSLADGLRRYRRRHARGLGAHAWMIRDYATGRRINAGERLLFSAASRDARVASAFEAFGSRNIGPARLFTAAIPRAVAVNVRHGLARNRTAARSQRSLGV